MAEREDERYVRELLARLHGIQLRKLRESTVKGVKTPDYEVLSEQGRIAVLEVKLLGRAARIEANGWTRDETGGLRRRDDNSAARVGAAIHEACKQLRAYAEPRLLALVNDDSMDFLDLREALDGYLVYGTEEVGQFRNLAGMRVAEGRIRDEKRLIDLYIWINRYEGRVPWRPSGLLPHEEPGKPFFVFGTDAGYALARRFFSVPECPKPEADPHADLPTLGEMLAREALNAKPRGRS
jgi:hypothetical protein